MGQPVANSLTIALFLPTGPAQATGHRRPPCSDPQLWCPLAVCRLQRTDSGRQTQLGFVDTGVGRAIQATSTRHFMQNSMQRVRNTASLAEISGRTDFSNSVKAAAASGHQLDYRHSAHFSILCTFANITGPAIASRSRRKLYSQAFAHEAGRRENRGFLKLNTQTGH